MSRGEPIRAPPLHIVGRELLNIAVEIGEGRTANILIREHDDPHIVSRQFAIHHGLSEQLREILEEQIRFNMVRVLSQRQAPLPKQQLQKPPQVLSARRANTPATNM